MTQGETNQTKRTIERAPQRAPGPAYWLIAKHENGRMEVLTLDRYGEEMLPVFSHEEEAEMFLGFGGFECGWRVKETMTGELVSVLLGPCAGVKEVALDPLPEMVAERMVGLVSLLRERFIECLTAGRRPLRLCQPGRGPSPREGERSRRSEAERIAAPEVMMHSKEEGMPVSVSSSCPFPIGDLGVALPNTPPGASQNLGTSYGIAFPRRNHRC